MTWSLIKYFSQILGQDMENIVFCLVILKKNDRNMNDYYKVANCVLKS